MRKVLLTLILGCFILASCEETVIKTGENSNTSRPDRESDIKKNK